MKLGIVWVHVLLVLSTTAGVIGNGIEFKKFKTEPGIYFAELGKAMVSTSDWRFVVYFNLSNYWHEWEYLKQSRDHLASACEAKPNTSNYIRHCKDLLQPISYLLDQVEDNNEMFKTHPGRMKRAPLDFVGNVFGDVFGVLNQRDAQKYNEQIEQLSKGTLRMHELLQQQIHVMDLTSNIIRKEHAQIKKQYQLLQGEIQTVVMHEEFLDVIFQLSATALLYKDIQGNLIDILSDVHHGRASTQLLPPTQFANQLGEVNQQIPNGIRVPSSRGHWIQVYKLLETKAAIVKNQIIFEVRIPLVQGDEFQIYNVIPVPTMHGDKFVFIEPHFAYVLVSNTRTWYHPISAEELKACKLWEEEHRICSLEGLMYKMSSTEEHCEISLLTHTEKPSNQCDVKAVIPTTFMYPLRSNHWIAALPKATVFEVICDQQTQLVELNGSGILSITPGCSLRGASMLIKSRTSFNTSGFSDVVPAFNLSKEIKTRALVLTSESLDAEISELQQTIGELKKDDRWLEIDIHHIANYTATSSALILAIVALVLGYRYHKRQKQHQNRKQRDEPSRRREAPSSANKENLV